VRLRHYCKRIGRWISRGGQPTASQGWAYRRGDIRGYAEARQSFKRTKHGRRVYPGGHVRYGAAAALLCCILASGAASAAISNTMQWDVRTTGSDSNGGGFDPGVASPGTDFSQQNSPQIGYSDLVIGATTSTYTSVLNPVGSTLPGNVLHIVSAVSGTCTAGWYEVLSNATITATVDRSLGTAASVCNASLGGSLATVSNGLAQMVAQNTLWVHSGTYTLTASLTAQNLLALAMFGYGSVHGDNGTRPLITTATNSTPLLNIPTGGANSPFVINNINFSNSAATRAQCIVKTSNTGAPITLSGSQLNGCSIGIDTSSQQTQLNLFNVEIENCTSDAIRSQSNASFLSNVYIHDNGGWGFNDTTSSQIEIAGSVFARNTSGGVVVNSGPLNIVSSVFYSNSGDGARLLQTTSAFGSSNSIYYGNSGWGIDQTNTSNSPASFYQVNAYGGPNTSGNVRHLTVHGNFALDIALTADPFVNGASGNFALNSTAGGGAALKGVGFPGVMPAGTGFIDVGALQSNAAASASVTAVGFVQ
jgi:hypothetical protein